MIDKHNKVPWSIGAAGSALALAGVLALAGTASAGSLIRNHAVGS